MIKIRNQFSIFLPNKPGELKKLLLKVKKINLSAAATFASKDGAIMRIVPQDPGSFAKILKNAGVSFSKQEVLMMTVNDKPGGLLRILSRMQRVHINIEGVYIVGESNGTSASCVIQVDDVKAAKMALE